MKIFLSSLLMMLCFMSVKQTIAQTLPSGTMSYSSENISKLNFGGQELEQKMNMSVTQDFSGEYYRLAASLQSSPSGTGSGININGGAQMFQYYDTADKFLYQLQQLKGKNYAVRVESQKITGLVKTGKTETILGYTCIEFTGIFFGETATGWYSTDLPSIVSPVGPLGLPGGLIKLESKKHKYTATKIKMGALVKESDLQLPKDVIKTTQEEFNRIRIQ
jgi:GLPGLI family protein